MTQCMKIKEKRKTVDMLVLVLAVYKTNIGLPLCTIGDHPKAGAYLSVDQSNLFVKEMVAGRGFMALAATIFGGWNPAGLLLANN